MKAHLMMAGMVAGSLVAAGAKAAPITTDVNYTVQYQIAYQPNVNPPTYTTTSTYAFVGQNSLGNLDKVMVVFELPELHGQTVQSATFTIHSGSKQGTPAGDAKLVHLPDANGTSIDASLYDATPADAVSGALMKPTDANNKDYHLDVTSAIQAEYADYASDGVATFRIEIPGVTSATTTNLYYFGKNDAHTTVLSIVSVPEPAAMSLLGLGCVLLMRRRK